METAGEGRAELLGGRASMCLGPGAPASAESCRSPGLMTPDPQGCKRSQKPRTLCKTSRSENVYTGLKGLPPGGHQPSLPVGRRGTPDSSSDFVSHPGGVAKELGNRLSTGPAHHPVSEPWGHGSNNGIISPNAEGPSRVSTPGPPPGRHPGAESRLPPTAR